MITPVFPFEILESRLAKLRHLMEEHHLDVCLISQPENIFYLTGLDHQGFFAFHVLIVPREGNMTLVARAMEAPTVAAQVKNALFVGFPDDMDPARLVVDSLVQNTFEHGQIGIEKNSPLITLRVAEYLLTCLPHAVWHDVTALLDKMRQVKAPIEIEYTRRAVEVASRMMQAAINTAQNGVSEREIAAEIYRAMVLSGGDYPGFHPFVRSTPTLGHEHVTWSDRVLESGDMLFVEIAGCVKRYHAPMGRLIFIDRPPPEIRKIEKVCLDAFDAVLNTMKPGVHAYEVYRAWQSVIDRAGLSYYRRHHCGYLVGIGFPPSWTGGNQVVGLREGSDFVLEDGMVFHTMSWLMHSGQGDYFVSDTVMITADGCEAPTFIPRSAHVV